MCGSYLNIELKADKIHILDFFDYVALDLLPETKGNCHKPIRKFYKYRVTFVCMSG